MFANCFAAGDFQCNGPAAYWPAPMLRRKTGGTAASIPPLKKSPLATLGSPLHRRSQLPARLNTPRHLEPHRLPAGNPRNRRTQEREDSRRHRALAQAVRLPPGNRLQCHIVPRLPRTTRSALPPPGSHSDSGQRLLPQGCRRLGMVQVQPALAGSASTATLFAGIEPYRKTVAAHPQERNTQSILRLRGRTARHSNQSLWRNAVPPRTDSLLPHPFLLI